MQRLEFINDALMYLVQLFPEMDKRLETEAQIDRWVVRFGHLELNVWKRAVDTYADDKHYPPTVNGLMEYVPPDFRTGQRKPDDPSRYDVRTYRAFSHNEDLGPSERLPAREVKGMLEELYAQFNARDMKGSGNN